jgi:malonyl-CoA O-methyltransferase
VSPPRLPASVATVRRQFEQRAARLAKRDVILREVAARMIDRLSYIRLAPRHVLDLGCGLGRTRDPLRERYPDAQWLGVDLAEAIARAGRSEHAQQRGLARWWRRTGDWIVADAGALPLSDASVDLLFCNLMLHWHPVPHTVFPEWKRVLRVDGLLMFSTFGPDTLKELRAAAREALPHAAPMLFVDMHDFGDMMVASGFATPVMDVEVLTLTYGSARELIADVRALGGNPRSDRWPALVSGAQAHRLLEAIEARRGTDGRIPLTFEIAYGHAWKPQPRPVSSSGISLDAVRAELALRKR